MSANGRICLPADVRASLGIKDGDVLHLTPFEGGCMLRTRSQAIAHARRLIRQSLKDATAFTVDDVLRDKREDVRREDARDGAPDAG